MVGELMRSRCVQEYMQCLHHSSTPVCIFGYNVHLNYHCTQLKNMIAALHSSRPGGTKMFDIGGVNYGWKGLEDLFLREVERARTNQLRRVPDLKESHIHRDCWTRLNVKPAKIMQVFILCMTFLLWLV